MALYRHHSFLYSITANHSHFASCDVEDGWISVGGFRLPGLLFKHSFSWMCDTLLNYLTHILANYEVNLKQISGQKKVSFKGRHQSVLPSK